MQHRPNRGTLLEIYKILAREGRTSAIRVHGLVDLREGESDDARRKRINSAIYRGVRQGRYYMEGGYLTLSPEAGFGRKRTWRQKLRDWLRRFA